MLKKNPVPEKSSSEKYLGLSISNLEAIGGEHTAKEISQQPSLWLKTWELLVNQQANLEAFLNEANGKEDLEVILTGAGSSAFIGNILQGPFQKNTKKRTTAIATTDLLSHPQQYFNSYGTTLLISFARSGNSPESVAAVNLADMYCKRVYHLFITCNPTGKLADGISQHPTYVFLLPQEADDQSLAMTGSFTSMLLAGLLISRIHIIKDLFKQIERLSRYGKNIIENYTSELKEVAQLEFERAVFLGSGPLQGTAKESSLKVQELTDGKVICKSDSFLGFRHGPKAVINPSTLLVYLFSNNEYVHLYETDLVKAINGGEKGYHRIGIFESGKKDLHLDMEIVLSNDEEKIPEEFLSVCCVLPAQILAFFKSINLGLTPDNPSKNGTITRVVQGVTIYPHPRIQDTLLMTSTIFDKVY